MCFFLVGISDWPFKVKLDPKMMLVDQLDPSSIILTPATSAISGHQIAVSSGSVQHQMQFQQQQQQHPQQQQIHSIQAAQQQQQLLNQHVLIQQAQQQQQEHQQQQPQLNMLQLQQFQQHQQQHQQQQVLIPQAMTTVASSILSSEASPDLHVTYFIEKFLFTIC